MNKLKEDKKMTMSNDVKPKQWYQLSNGVEYSKDFKFFSEHQIRIVRSNITYSFCSRLEAKTFRTTKALFGDHKLSDDQIAQICKEIHKEIFEGKHGQGTLVD